MPGLGRVLLAHAVRTESAAGADRRRRCQGEGGDPQLGRPRRGVQPCRQSLGSKHRQVLRADLIRLITARHLTQKREATLRWSFRFRCRSCCSHDPRSSPPPSTSCSPVRTLPWTRALHSAPTATHTQNASSAQHGKSAPTVSCSSTVATPRRSSTPTHTTSTATDRTKAVTTSRPATIRTSSPACSPDQTPTIRRRPHQRVPPSQLTIRKTPAHNQ